MYVLNNGQIWFFTISSLNIFVFIINSRVKLNRLMCFLVSSHSLFYLFTFYSYVKTTFCVSYFLHALTLLSLSLVAGEWGSRVSQQEVGVYKQEVRRRGELTIAPSLCRLLACHTLGLGRKSRCGGGKTLRNLCNPCFYSICKRGKVYSLSICVCSAERLIKNNTW